MQENTRETVQALFLKARSLWLVVIILVGICGLGLFLRIDAYLSVVDHTCYPDVHRDFIVGHQMITYGELPLTGPNGHFGAGVNSPFYYYFIAALLDLFGDNVHVLQFANLLLQSATPLLTYFVVRALYSRKTAVLAALFSAIFLVFVEQAICMWQPHLMQIFFLFSLLFLARSYTKPSRALLFLSIVFFSFGVVTHNSLVALLPAYALALFFILRKNSVPLREYVFYILFFIANIVFLFIPVLVFYLGETSSGFNLYRFDATLLLKPEAIAIGFKRFMEVFLRIYFYYLPPQFMGVLGPSLLLASGIYLYHERKNKKTLALTTIIVCAICSMLFVAGTISNLVAYSTEFPLRYFTPLFIPFTILLSVFIGSLVAIKRGGMVLMCGAAIAVVFWCSPLLQGGYSEVAHTAKLSIASFLKLQPTGEAYTIKKIIEDLSLTNRFDITSVFWSGHTPVFDYANELLWSPLISISNAQYLTLDDTKLRGYRTLGVPDYLFIKCSYIDVAVCSNLIKTEMPRYIIRSDVLPIVTRDGTTFLLEKLQ